MERQRQRNLKFFLCKLIHLRNDSAGRNRNISLTDIKPVFICQHPQKCQNIVIIIQRFSAPHHNDIAHPFACDTLYPVYLIQHFRWQKSSFQTIQRRRAETTAHPAAYLRRNTYRIAVLILHPYAFYQIPVRQSEQKFFCPIDF